MPDIDTSPAALRALADDKNPWSDGPIWPFKWLPVIRDVLRAIADEKEKAEAERDSAWRTGYKACVDTVLSYEAHYDWMPLAAAQDGAEIAMQAIKDCVVRSAERAGVVALANPEGPAHG